MLRNSMKESNFFQERCNSDKINDKKKKCKTPTCVDLFVFVAIIIAIFNCTLVIAENFIDLIDYSTSVEELRTLYKDKIKDLNITINSDSEINNNMLFYRIYNSAFFSVACVLCFLLTLPCHRESAYSSKLTGMFGVLLLAQVMSYFVEDLYLTYSKDKDYNTFLLNVQSLFGDYVKNASIYKIVVNLTIYGYIISGFSMCILSIWHQYGLNYHSKLKTWHIFRCILHDAILSLCSIFCFCLAFPLIFPMNWFPAELPLQPRIISIVLRLGTSLIILLCLFSFFSRSRWSSAFLFLFLLGHLGMLVISAANFSFPLDSQWIGYTNPDLGKGVPPHKEILIFWILTSTITFTCFLLNCCCNPKIRLKKNFDESKSGTKIQSIDNNYNHMYSNSNHVPNYFFPHSQASHTENTPTWV